MSSKTVSNVMIITSIVMFTISPIIEAHASHEYFQSTITGAFLIMGWALVRFIACTV